MQHKKTISDQASACACAQREDRDWKYREEELAGWFVKLMMVASHDRRSLQCQKLQIFATFGEENNNNSDNNNKKHDDKKMSRIKHKNVPQALGVGLGVGAHACSNGSFIE